MKRVLPLAVMILFLASIFIIPQGVSVTSKDSQETASHNEIHIEQDNELSWIPPDKTVRVAVYDEKNSTNPSWVSFSGIAHNNVTYIRDVLLSYGYDVTLLTAKDISNQELRTANYDVFVMPDNFPRENITNRVMEFWLGGGGILSFDGSSNFLCYHGILPTEAAGSSGYSTYWAFIGNDFNITARHPVTKSYALNQTISGGGNQFRWDYSVLQSTSHAGDIVQLARSNHDPDFTSALAFNPSDRGGKVVTIAFDLQAEYIPELEQMYADAVEWLCPRPKGYILYDLTHDPNFSTDSWDTTSGYPTYYQDMRNLLVNHSFCVDKLHPNAEGNLTIDNLEGYDALITATPRLNYSASEVSAVTTWVHQGGGLLAVGDLTPGDQETATRINYLVSNFDMEINMTSLNSDYDSAEPTIHPLTEDCATMEFYNPKAYVNLSGSAESVWYTAGDVWLGADEVQSGRLILSGDSNIFQNSFLRDYEDHQRFILNLANWFTAKEASILAFIDENSIDEDPNDNPFRGPVAQALNELEIPWYFSSDGAYFNRSLYAQDWDLVIVDQFGANLNAYWGDFLEYVQSGERLIFQSMQLNQLVANAQAFRDYVGILYPSGPITPTPSVYFWPGSEQIQTYPSAYGANNISVDADYLFNTCQNLTYHENGTAIAGLSSVKPENRVNATAILGVGGNVLVNGMMLTAYDNDTDDSTYKDNYELWRNQIGFMLRPLVDNPGDMIIEVGSRTDSIDWDAYSNHPEHYTIERNSVEILNEPWDGTPITLPLEEDNLGTEEFRLTLYDNLGFSVTDTVSVTKEDTTAPVFDEVPSNLEYQEGKEEHYMNWSINDLFSDRYRLYLNDTEFSNGSLDYTIVSEDLGGLTEGVYNVTLVVNDTSDNEAISTVFLNVTAPDTTTTTTETTTETSTTTGTTTSETDTDPWIIDFVVENLIVIALIGAILLIIVIILVVRKRS